MSSEHKKKYKEEDKINNIEIAVEQLKAGLHRTEVERLVDEFFLENLPTEVFRRRRSQLFRGNKDSKKMSEELSLKRQSFDAYYSSGGSLKLAPNQHIASSDEEEKSSESDIDKGKANPTPSRRIRGSKVGNMNQ